jgi:hypothetical protein
LHLRAFNPRQKKKESGAGRASSRLNGHPNAEALGSTLRLGTSIRRATAMAKAFVVCKAVAIEEAAAASMAGMKRKPHGSK